MADDERQQKFDAAATRFARAVAPLIAGQIRYAQSQGQESPSATQSLQMTLGQVVTHFASLDGAVTGAEARAYEKVVGTEGGSIANIVESAGAIKAGPLMDLFKSMGDTSRFEAAVGSSIRLLHAIHGMDVVKEYLLSLRALGAATCNLDGRSEAESEALANLDELLKATLAELE